jgi:hypothetical protein
MKTAYLAQEDLETRKSHAMKEERGDEAEVEAGPLVEEAAEDTEAVEGGMEVIVINQDLRYPLCSKNVVKHLIHL